MENKNLFTEVCKYSVVSVYRNNHEKCVISMQYTFLAPCGLRNGKDYISEHSVLGKSLLALLLLVVAVAAAAFVAVLFVYYLIESLSCDSNMTALQPFYMFYFPTDSFILCILFLRIAYSNSSFYNLGVSLYIVHYSVTYQAYSI
jgi:hypothetical protein